MRNSHFSYSLTARKLLDVGVTGVHLVTESLLAYTPNISLWALASLVEVLLELGYSSYL